MSFRVLTLLRPRIPAVSSFASASVKRIQETQQGNVLTVELVEAEKPKASRVFPTHDHDCPLCAIPKKISYSDVLILEQFMREDGTVLPRELTGLCKKQQLILERCVMQAHWAGLFPDRTLPEFDRAGYKRFNRYWKDDMDMYRLKTKVEPGTWYFVKRYLSKKGEFAKPLPKTS